MQEFVITKTQGKVEGLEQVADALSFMQNGIYNVTIKQARKNRSISQNRLMWAWFNCLYEYTGTPKNDIYKHYCERFLRKPIEFNGKTEWATGGTSELNTKQFTEFLNEIQADAATEFGCRLPTPEDRGFEQFFAKYDR